MSTPFTEWMVRLIPDSDRARFQLSLYDRFHDWRLRCEERFGLNPHLRVEIERLHSQIGGFKRGIRREDVTWLGTLLAGILLPGKVRRELTAELKKLADRSCVLRVRLDIQDEQMRMWPWEYVYLRNESATGGGEFLGTSPYVSLVRQSSGPAPRGFRGRTARVLIVWANPQTRELGACGGLQDICSAEWAFKQLLSDTVELRFLGGERGAREHIASAANIRHALRSASWDIVLFVCHGTESGLLVESLEGSTPQRMTAPELAELLRSAGVQLALFDACESRHVAAAVAAVVPVVVAMQFPVTLPAAATFWRSFFHAVSARMPIDLCVVEGRQWIEAMADDLPDWGTPILYRGAPTNYHSEIATAPTVDWVASQTHERSEMMGTSRFRSTRKRGVRKRIGELIERIGDSLMRAGVSQAPVFVQDTSYPLVAAHRWTPAVLRSLRGKDPLDLLLLGPEQAVRWSQPIWWTALMASPAFLVWPHDRQAVRYSIELDDGISPQSLTFDTENNILELPENLCLPRGAPIVWEVTLITDQGVNISSTKGVFRILDGEDANDVQRKQQEISRNSEDLVGAITLASMWASRELYDDAIRLLHVWAQRHVAGAEAFLVRRTLASVFQDVYTAMNRSGAWPGPEVSWAGAENAEQIKLAYCAALERLPVWRAGGCSSCRQCGLVGEGSEEND